MDKKVVNDNSVKSMQSLFSKIILTYKAVSNFEKNKEKLSLNDYIEIKNDIELIGKNYTNMKNNKSSNVKKLFKDLNKTLAKYKINIDNVIGYNDEKCENLIKSISQWEEKILKRASNYDFSTYSEIRDEVEETKIRMNKNPLIKLNPDNLPSGENIILRVLSRAPSL